MIDLDRIEGFDWDYGNARKSEDKHRVSQAEAEQVFFNLPRRFLDDKNHSADEERIIALGQTNGGRRLFIVFTLRQQGTRIRIISARDMNRKERTIYAQEI